MDAGVSIYAAFGSSIIVFIGLAYKAYRLMIQDYELYDRQMICIPADKVKFVQVETELTPLDIKINEIKSLIKEMEYHHDT